ncbi:MAG: DUF3119 family protein [Pleurocapsa sp.]
MATNIETANVSDVVELSPSYKLPILIIIGALPLFWVQIWLAGAIALFGLFLVVQTALIRLKFTTTALDIYRSDKMIRRFPYDEWLNWEIFFPPVPILFYFREVNSIHFLPIIFDPKALSDCLQKYCSRKQP